jgi:hypothetical protein
VSHNDREIEFCSQKDEIDRQLDIKKNDPTTSTWSCEQWALFLLDQFTAGRVEVNEDNENGAVVTRL